MILLFLLKWIINLQHTYYAIIYNIITVSNISVLLMLIMYSIAARRDPGVPNSLPFKEDILVEAEINKKRVCDCVFNICHYYIGYHFKYSLFS